MSIFDKFPYIVIEGPIGSGKTTLAKMLADKFNAQLLSEKAEANPFLPRFYQDAQRYALPTQLFFLFQRSRQIADLNQLYKHRFYRSGFRNTLLLISLAGGWPGALLAQQLMRHKTSKRSFINAFWITVLFNVGAFVAWHANQLHLRG